MSAPETEGRLPLDVRLFGGNRDDHRKNASYIAALSPDKLLKLIAVVEAARASTDVFEEATGYVGCSAFSPSMESECKTALAALRSTLKELDK